MALLINEIKRQNEAIAPELSAALERVLSRGWYVLGPEVEAFERDFAEYCGVSCCVSVANGTDALELALKAMKLAPGSRVATVANAGMYSTTAIMQAGAYPVYVDIEPQWMTMDPAALRAVIDQYNPAAVIVTHLYGQMAQIAEIREITVKAGLPLIEDCAQAHGATACGRKAGSWGDLACFSFYPTKNLGALGDGGAVTTGNAEIAQTLRCLRQYGWTEKYRSAEPGGRNSRLDEMQAAILRAKLPHLDGWNERRRATAARYSSAFENLPLRAPCMPDESYVAHLYVIRTPDRVLIRDGLKAAGIATDVHYPIPDYRQASVAPQLQGAMPQLPLTEQCCDHVLTLPCFPEMTDAEVDTVIQAVHRVCASKELTAWAKI
jgi:dTDP-4-amino-4,6-dideoxygalactose transaminase